MQDPNAAPPVNAIHTEGASDMLSAGEKARIAAEARTLYQILKVFSEETNKPTRGINWNGAAMVAIIGGLLTLFTAILQTNSSRLTNHQTRVQAMQDKRLDMLSKFGKEAAVYGTKMDEMHYDHMVLSKSNRPLGPFIERRTQAEIYKEYLELEKWQTQKGTLKSYTAQIYALYQTIAKKPLGPGQDASQHEQELRDITRHANDFDQSLEKLLPYSKHEDFVRSYAAYEEATRNLIYAMGTLLSDEIDADNRVDAWYSPQTWLPAVAQLAQPASWPGRLLWMAIGALGMAVIFIAVLLVRRRRRQKQPT
jgi:hypothetical protein